MPQKDVVIRLAGTAGEGALSLGEILGRAFARLGWELMLSFSFEAEVRGEKPSYSQLRVSDEKPLSQGGMVDVLVALNKDALLLNLPELAPGGAVIYDGSPIDAFRGVTAYEPSLPGGACGIPVPFEVISQEKIGFPSAKNMAALGAVVRVLGLPSDMVASLVEARFSRKGDIVTGHNLAALGMGHDHLSGLEPLHRFGQRGAPKLMVSGNQACATGAIAGGCRFFAGYPITPATEVMEYMAKELPAFGGTVIQAEDEMAALGMVMGASFAGTRAMTATSGPGLSLMSELVGLASTAEVPAVILDVQRGGPGTGLPTRPEQSDLFLALHCGHGNPPRMVLAPTTVEECYTAAGRAHALAERYQMPVIVLTDQYIAYRRETLDALPPQGAADVRVKHAPEELEGYRRYRITETGISPVSIPGEPGGMFVATGLEHSEAGLPAYDAATHIAMMDKRARKLVTASSEKWAHRFGAEDADVGVIAWGGVAGAAMEAVGLACREGIRAAGYYTVFLSPLPEEEMRGFIRSVRRVIVPELNHDGQFARLLRERFLVEPVSLALPLGGPFPVSAILDAIRGG